MIEDTEVTEGAGTGLVFVRLLSNIERNVVINYTTEGVRGGATGK